MKVIKELIALEKEAEAFGFKWEKTTQIVDQIKSECEEVSVHLQNHAYTNELQEELGDLLHATYSLCIFCQYDPEETLSKAVTKMKRRFQAVKKIALEEGHLSLAHLSFDMRMSFWDKAKKLVG